MTTFKRGDVVLVAFPFTDLTTTKTRPALVISSNAFHHSGLDVILAAITSQIPKEIPFTDFLLSPNDQTLAGLPKTSLVRLGKIVTLDKRLIRKKLGHISETSLAKLTAELFEVLSSESLNDSYPSVHERPAVYKVRAKKTVKTKKKHAKKISNRKRSR